MLKTDVLFCSIPKNGEVFSANAEELEFGSGHGPLGSPEPDIENDFFVVDQFISTAQ